MKNLRGTPKEQGMWTLPSASLNQGSVLVLPIDIGLFEQVFERWRSITLNHVNEKPWADNQTKVDYVENLLKYYEKLVFIQLRTMYEEEYRQLVSWWYQQYIIPDPAYHLPWRSIPRRYCWTRASSIWSRETRMWKYQRYLLIYEGFLSASSKIRKDVHGWYL